IDALVGTSAKDDLHMFFVKQNSYMHPQQKFIQAMNETTKEFNFKTTFMLTFFSYLRANFLTSPLSKSTILKLIKSFGPERKGNSKLNKHIQVICEMGEKLDPLFRYKTTANYFKQLGFVGDVEELLAFDFMKLFESHPEWGTVVKEMSDSISINPLDE
ncbi:MAG: hypothetical protein ACK5V3_10745, partial [Bdellovibrionales bacterium]